MRTVIRGTGMYVPDNIVDNELLSRLMGALVKQPTPVQVLRGGQPVTMDVTIGER